MYGLHAKDLFLSFEIALIELVHSLTPTEIDEELLILKIKCQVFDILTSSKGSPTLCFRLLITQTSIWIVFVELVGAKRLGPLLETAFFIGVVGGLIRLVTAISVFKTSLGTRV